MGRSHYWPDFQFWADHGGDLGSCLLPAGMAFAWIYLWIIAPAGSLPPVDRFRLHGFVLDSKDPSLNRLQVQRWPGSPGLRETTFLLSRWPQDQADQRPLHAGMGVEDPVEARERASGYAPVRGS